KTDEGFDPTVIFTGIGSFIRWIYRQLEVFIDTARGLQFTPYYIAAVYFIFFFFWMPLHVQATAVWFQLFVVAIPFVLPALLYYVTNEAYYEYMRVRNYYAHGYCVLEIKLPDEITQTP